MALNENIKNLIRYIVDNDIQKAKKVVKVIIANEKPTSTAQQFCKNISAKLEMQGNNLIELPQNLSSILYMEDVKTSFNPNRYYLTDKEKDLLNKIQSNCNINDQLLNLGIKHLNTTMLHGDSGTGKTTFGRYVAYMLDVPFAYLNFSHCIDSYLGATQKNIQRVFEYISKTKCVFMLDEIDAIGLARGSGSEVGEMSRVVISLMQSLDLLNNDAVVIGATNRLDILDKAILRRFTLLHEIKSLTEQDTINMIKQYLDDINIRYDEYNISEYAKTHNKQSEIVNNIVQSIIVFLSENKPFLL